jgi:hypothetical protein
MSTDSRTQVVENAQTWDGAPYHLGGWSRTGIDCRGLWYEALLAAGLADSNGGKLGTVRAIKASAIKRGFWHPLESGYVPQPGDGAVYASKVGRGKGLEHIEHIAIVTSVGPGYSPSHIVGTAFSALSPKRGTHAHVLNLLPKEMKILGYVELNVTGGGAPAPSPFPPPSPTREVVPAPLHQPINLRAWPNLGAPVIRRVASGGRIQTGRTRTGGVWVLPNGQRGSLWFEALAVNGVALSRSLWVSAGVVTPAPPSPTTKRP